jgi:hypothetical protein
MKRQPPRLYILRGNTFIKSACSKITMRSTVAFLVLIIMIFFVSACVTDDITIVDMGPGEDDYIPTYDIDVNDSEPDLPMNDSEPLNTTVDVIDVPLAVDEELGFSSIVGRATKFKGKFVVNRVDVMLKVPDREDFDVDRVRLVLTNPYFESETTYTDAFGCDNPSHVVTNRMEFFAASFIDDEMLEICLGTPRSIRAQTEFMVTLEYDGEVIENRTVKLPNSLNTLEYTLYENS